MHNFKLFPSSKLLTNSDENDRRFLEHLITARRDCNARYVNFSVYHYEPANIEPIHIITYPMDWIIHYIQSQYHVHDPLFQTDFRRVSCIDWTDVYNDEKSEPLFREFQERNLGNQGITLSSRIKENQYAVASFVFQIGDEMWTAHRSANMEMLRLQTVNLSERHEAVYFNRQIKDYKITNRERQCLYWVAMGKTDEQIADILSIGRWTVVGHLKSAKYKLDCSNRASAVATAMALEIIDIRKPMI